MKSFVILLLFQCESEWKYPAFIFEFGEFSSEKKCPVYDCPETKTEDEDFFDYNFFDEEMFNEAKDFDFDDFDEAFISATLATTTRVKKLRSYF